MTPYHHQVAKQMQANQQYCIIIKPAEQKSTLQIKRRQRQQREREQKKNQFDNVIT